MRSTSTAGVIFFWTSTTARLVFETPGLLGLIRAPVPVSRVAPQSTYIQRGLVRQQPRPNFGLDGFPAHNDWLSPRRTIWVAHPLGVYGRRRRQVHIWPAPSCIPLDAWLSATETEPRVSYHGRFCTFQET